MDNLQVSISSNQSVVTRDGLTLQIDEAIIRVDADSTPHPDGYSFLNQFTSFELGNYHMITLLSVACDMSGGIRLFPATPVTKGQILRIRFRQNTFNDYDVMEYMDQTSYEHEA